MIQFLIQFDDPILFDTTLRPNTRKNWIGKLDRKLDRPFQKIGSPNFWPNHMIQFYDPISHPAAQPATGPIVWTPGASEMGPLRASVRSGPTPISREIGVGPDLTGEAPGVLCVVRFRGAKLEPKVGFGSLLG